MTEPSPTQVAEQLASILGALRRSTLRAARAGELLPDLPRAQVEVLRRLTHGPASPSHLASELSMARSTVSNLLRELSEAGYVERERSAADARSQSVSLTSTGHSVVSAVRQGRTDALAAAFAGLPPDSRRLVAEAVPALAQLQQAIDAAIGGPGGEQRVDPGP